MDNHEISKKVFQRIKGEARRMRLEALKKRMSPLASGDESSGVDDPAEEAAESPEEQDAELAAGTDGPGTAKAKPVLKIVVSPADAAAEDPTDPEDPNQPDEPDDEDEAQQEAIRQALAKMKKH